MAFDAFDTAADELMAVIERQNPSRARTFRRTCSECGTEHLAAARHADFCTTECRKAFNNRRLVRGAELYDLVMVLRYERPIAKALKVWKLICRLAAVHRDEDVRQREGRHSWRPAKQVIERYPYLAATSISNTTWRRAI